MVSSAFVALGRGGLIHPNGQNDKVVLVPTGMVQRSLQDVVRDPRRRVPYVSEYFGDSFASEHVIVGVAFGDSIGVHDENRARHEVDDRFVIVNLPANAQEKS